MNTTEFCKKRDELLERKADFERQINEAYTEVTKEFIKANCSIVKGMVYELVSGGHRRRGCDRFVVFDIKARTLFENKYTHILVSGWWLDKNSIPKKWDSYQVYGDVSPISIFKLSENQKHEEVTREIMNKQ